MRAERSRAERGTVPGAEWALVLCVQTFKCPLDKNIGSVYSKASHPLINDLNVHYFLLVSVPSLFPGVHYRKSCASSGACLIASSGYQQFCTGRLNSVCITCCNTPLCNGLRHKKRPPSSKSSAIATLPLAALPVSSLLWQLLW